jgi:hypothetical protein
MHIYNMTSMPISTSKFQHFATLGAYVSPEVISGHVRTSPIKGRILKFTTEEIEAGIVLLSWPVTEPCPSQRPMPC